MYTREASNLITLPGRHLSYTLPSSGTKPAISTTSALLSMPSMNAAFASAPAPRQRALHGQSQGPDVVMGEFLHMGGEAGEGGLVPEVGWEAVEGGA